MLGLYLIHVSKRGCIVSIVFLNTNILSNLNWILNEIVVQMKRVIKCIVV